VPTHLRIIAGKLHSLRDLTHQFLVAKEVLDRNAKVVLESSPAFLEGGVLDSFRRLGTDQVAVGLRLKANSVSS
jgi:hypothetical protein